MCFYVLSFNQIHSVEKIRKNCRDLRALANSQYSLLNGKFSKCTWSKVFLSYLFIKSRKNAFPQVFKRFHDLLFDHEQWESKKMEIIVKSSTKPKFFTNFAEKSSIFSLTLCLSPNCPTLELCVCQMVISCILWITKSPVCAFMCLLSKLLISGMKSRKFHANFELRPTATTHF